MSERLKAFVTESPEGRVTSESRLLAAEALLASEPMAATESLSPLLTAKTKLAPDLFGEAELVAGKVLEAAGATKLARVHLERAVQTFGAIGHFVGKQRSLDQLHELTGNSTLSSDEADSDKIPSIHFVQCSTYAKRADLLRTRPFCFSEKPNCLSKIRLIAESGNGRKGNFQFPQ